MPHAAGALVQAIGLGLFVAGLGGGVGFEFPRGSSSLILSTDGDFDEHLPF